MSLTQRILVVAAIESAYFIATRVVLHYLPWSSVEAEAIRTILRLATAVAYWWLARPLILSRTPIWNALRNPFFVIGMLLFMSVPVLIGQYKLAAPVALLFAVTSVPVAFKEEFLFRGIVQNLLTQKLGVLKAVFATSIIFTAWHVGAWQFSVGSFAQIFLASVVLGVIYVSSGSILAAIVIHAIYDALFSFSPFLPNPLPGIFGFLPLLASACFFFCWFQLMGMSGRIATSHG